MSILENSVVKLRALEPEDAELLYVWENDPEVWQAGETIVPFSRHTLHQYVANASTQDIYEAKQLRLMIDCVEKKELITVGTIDLFDFDPYNKRAGVGVLVYSQRNRQKGYASAALQLLIQYAFNTLQMHQLYCNVAMNNEKSLHLFQSHGFEIIGVKREWLYCNNEWFDECLLQLIKK